MSKTGEGERQRGGGGGRAREHFTGDACVHGSKLYIRAAECRGDELTVNQEAPACAGLTWQAAAGKDNVLPDHLHTRVRESRTSATGTDCCVCFEGWELFAIRMNTCLLFTQL